MANSEQEISVVKGNEISSLLAKGQEQVDAGNIESANFFLRQAIHTEMKAKKASLPAEVKPQGK